VQHISALPGEPIDRRLISPRDSDHKVSYRVASSVAIVLICADSLVVTAVVIVWGIDVAGAGRGA
jgi:hypothetical protein